MVPHLGQADEAQAVQLRVRRVLQSILEEGRSVFESRETLERHVLDSLKSEGLVFQCGELDSHASGMVFRYDTSKKPGPSILCRILLRGEFNNVPLEIAQEVGAPVQVEAPPLHETIQPS